MSTAHFHKGSPGWDITEDTFMDIRAERYTTELFYSSSELEPSIFRVHLARYRLYSELFFCAYCEDVAAPLWILRRLCI